MASRFDVTALGEMLLRVTVPSGMRLERAVDVSLGVAGSEGNVLATLASLGRSCGYVTAVPVGPLGQRIVNAVSGMGVDCQACLWEESGRVGTYFVELASPPRVTRVTYDRFGSVATKMSVASAPWAYLLNTRILHLTGITPALSSSCHELVSELCMRAAAAGVAISLDLNYRQALWSAPEAAAALEPLMRQASLILAAQRDLATLFDLRGSPEEAARQLAASTGASWVVVTAGPAGAGLWGQRRWWFEPAPRVTVVDRIGAGDALAAGVLSGLLDSNVPVGLRRGVMLAAMALTQRGDIVECPASELEAALEATEALDPVR